MLGAKMKYVTFDGCNGEQIIIFPKEIQHSHFANSIEELSFGIMRPIAGGFIVDGQCVGESESLRMKSRFDVDTALIAKLVDIVPDGFDAELKAIDKSNMLINKLLSKNKSKRLRKQARK